MEPAKQDVLSTVLMDELRPVLAVIAAVASMPPKQHQHCQQCCISFELPGFQLWGPD
jgi:hypothetical protein